MALFDNFNAALLGGMGIGTRIGDANQQMRQDDARLKLAYAQMEQQNQAQRSRVDIERQELAMRQQDQAMRQRQQGNAEQEYARARDQTAADQQLNTSEYRNLVSTPRLGQAAQSADWGQHGAGLLDDAQAAQGDLDTFGRASPQSQAQALAAPRQAVSQTKAAEIRQKMADGTFQAKLKALWSPDNNIPPDKKKAIEQKLIAEHQGLTGDLPMGEQEYTTSPAFALLPEQYRPWALQYFKANGQPPPRELLGGLDHPQKQANDEQQTGKSADIAAKKYAQARIEHEDAEKRLADFDAANKKALAKPPGKPGQGLPGSPTEDAWSAYTALLPQRRRLEEAANKAKARRDAADAAAQQALDAAGAAIQSSPTIGGRQATPTQQQAPQPPAGSPNAAADEDQAAEALLDQLQAMFPDWATNPQSEALLRAVMQQQAAPR